MLESENLAEALSMVDYESGSQPDEAEDPPEPLALPAPAPVLAICDGAKPLRERRMEIAAVGTMDIRSFFGGGSPIALENVRNAAPSPSPSLAFSATSSVNLTAGPNSPASSVRSSASTMEWPVPVPSSDLPPPCKKAKKAVEQETTD